MCALGKEDGGREEDGNRSEEAELIHGVLIGTAAPQFLDFAPAVGNVSPSSLVDHLAVL